MDTVVWRAASLLLSYPDQRLYDRRPMLRTAVADLPDGVARRRLDAFLDHLDRTPPMGLTVHFLDVCRGGRLLLLADHREEEERRMARARLADLYRAYDHDMDDEPPDSLPAMLEYAALCADDWLLREHQVALERLHAALDAKGSPYTVLVEAVRATLMRPPNTARRVHTARGVRGCVARAGRAHRDLALATFLQDGERS
ncbi:nitrate reductase molybdenum cofactor assembly chaperone [Actinomadura rugatobispora]|uniref:Nitrate reductase molybdenum cofactor assembly chaperone n=1 Tax=Actinomadura rugatobispora TaxID=1994 RepID=A0ABW1A1B4_9ACTN